MLEAQGMHPVPEPENADVIIFMTCCVRENADERLRGQVASLKVHKTPSGGGPLIAVGGCIGQRDGATLLEQLPHIDVVFGTHNLAHLPALLASAHEQRAAAHPAPTVEILDSSTEFASDLPSVREHPWHAWVPITVGCDNFCTYCIVPYVRGRERSRPLEEIVDECERLVADGVREVTLLGQNVNSYGRDLYGEPRFAQVLRAVAETGVDWIRFATSHPKDLSDDTIAAMAELPQVCRSLHLPVQSGSTRILQAMNRTYTREQYLDLVSRLYAAIPDLALSTDVIVGFPGETEEDFEDTLSLIESMQINQAFTFIYSPREGTPAARLKDRVPRDIIQTRFDRLVDLVQESAGRGNQPLTGTLQRVLVEGTSKRDESMLTGRNEGNKVIHAPLLVGQGIESLVGKFVNIRITDAQKWFLMGEIEGDIAS